MDFSYSTARCGYKNATCLRFSNGPRPRSEYIEISPFRLATVIMLVKVKRHAYVKQRPYMEKSSPPRLHSRTGTEGGVGVGSGQLERRQTRASGRGGEATADLLPKDRQRPEVSQWWRSWLRCSWLVEWLVGLVRWLGHTNNCKLKLLSPNLLLLVTAPTFSAIMSNASSTRATATV